VILEVEEDKEEDEEEEGETACCPRILVVDDDEFNIQALSCLLENLFGERCHRAFNGEMALTMVQEKQRSSKCECYYSLILLDCNMPIMNGFDACRKLC